MPAKMATNCKAPAFEYRVLIKVLRHVRVYLQPHHRPVTLAKKRYTKDARSANIHGHTLGCAIRIYALIHND